MAHIETSDATADKSEHHRLHQHQTPASQSPSDYLLGHYKANTNRHKDIHLPDAYWAWRTEIDHYIDNGFVEDHLFEEVFSKVFRNIDEQDLNLTMTEKTEFTQFMNDQLQEFSSTVGLALMAAACDVDAALLDFVHDMKSVNVEVH